MQGILVENQEGNHVKQLRLEISHGRFTKLGARFSIVAANLSGIFQVFAGFNAQTQEGKQKKIKET